jgi:hypothetical protein
MPDVTKANQPERMLSMDVTGICSQLLRCETLRTAFIGCPGPAFRFAGLAKLGKADQESAHPN